jgi:hypothetical protein
MSTTKSTKEKNEELEKLRTNIYFFIKLIVQA